MGPLEFRLTHICLLILSLLKSSSQTSAPLPPLPTPELDNRIYPVIQSRYFSVHTDSSISLPLSHTLSKSTLNTHNQLPPSTSQAIILGQITVMSHKAQQPLKDPSPPGLHHSKEL